MYHRLHSSVLHSPSWLLDAAYRFQLLLYSTLDADTRGTDIHTRASTTTRSEKRVTTN